MTRTPTSPERERSRCIGTIKKNRLHSDNKLPGRLEKKQIKFYSNSPDNSLLFILWEDRGTVRMITNIYLTKTTTFRATTAEKVTTQAKPNAALEYNKYAKCVDIFREITKQKITHKEFLESIILSLLGEPKKKYQKRKVDKLHLPDPENKSQGRCKVKDCKGKQVWKCSTCSSGENNGYLCMPDCWKKYHKSL